MFMLIARGWKLWQIFSNLSIQFSFFGFVKQNQIEEVITN